MPQTLQDAVEITRSLDVRYLWIDALCIIQVKEGKNEDWQRELSDMGKIYKHSLFTIAASSARNSNAGLFYRTEASRWPVQDYHLVDKDGPHNSETLTLRPTLPSWDVSVEQSELSSRGWVLQERYLASRTLFWTDDGLFWQCGEMCLSECEGTPLNNRVLGTIHEVADRIRDYRIDESSRIAWLHVLRAFSRKKFTVETDRLPAVEGLMSELSRLTGRHYELGVWKHNLIFELAWMVDLSVSNGDDPSDSRVARLPGIPSWSWGSVNQELRFGCLRARENRELALNASIHAHEVRIRARMGYLHLRKMDIEDGVPVKPKTVHMPGKTANELAIFDASADALPAEGGTIKCIAWLGWKYRSQDNVDMIIGAMMITPVDQERKIYRRIGWVELVELVGEGLFGTEYQDITLV
ncbi:hypothetical protein ST47_g7163 [Ascochyta rabiei]|uniref:Heterokaryon incompatibility domain-containing protein n=1 Tax=Didymella rabiei TaxID=5454 RepID=A0A163BHL2_DIDRA|nr:hypothetical protein ST47_g7163 [Ascochyta rabiei]